MSGECPVCMEPFASRGDGAEERPFACAHGFCTNCSRRLLLGNMVCPMCRASRRRDVNGDPGRQSDVAWRLRVEAGRPWTVVRADTLRDGQRLVHYIAAVGDERNALETSSAPLLATLGAFTQSSEIATAWHDLLHVPEVPLSRFGRR